FTYTMIKNSVTLTLKVTPADASVLINKENYSGQKNIELAPSRYKIEISKNGFSEISDFVDMELGKPVTKTYTLEQKTGKLQVTVKPVDAKIELKQNGTIINSWEGSNYLRSVPVGTYTLAAQKAGHKTKSKELVITENQTATIDIVLEPELTKQIAKLTNKQAAQNNLPQMVFVKGGTFPMGSNDGGSDEKPIHQVTVNDFYIGKYEVTFEEYDKFCEATGRTKPKDNGWGRGKRPVIYVSWNDAKAYCEWAGGRLPTEAEWEYAARGGIQSQGYTYSGSNSIAEVAWYSGNSGNKTHEFGTKKGNELGIYDMSGNVWEWCSDWYGNNYYTNSPGNNPKGQASGTSRVLRGGSWYDNVYYCRVANRDWGYPDITYSYYGFRIVQDSL
ncbi:MAG: SUMF1/EgtB/PvdO family nonheme iron enzyme, partial [Bacteroidota bacterium]